MVLEILKFNVREKKYNEAYKTLKLLIMHDVKNNKCKSKEEYLKYYSDLLISLGCFKDLKKQWLIEKLNKSCGFVHNDNVVYYDTDSIKEVNNGK